MTPQARADTSGALTALVDAAAERLEIAEPVAAFKWAAHVAIEDPARVEQELAILREDAVSSHVDPDYVARVFQDQVNATEALEYQRFADWKLDPASAPAAPADLATSRAAIDALNTKILSQISLKWSLLNSPLCADELSAATATAIRVRRLEDRYGRALTAATRSYCQVPPQS
ncbi:chorismate mutase [Mycobacterium asiaticum]|uniref:Chorismate mutase n=2 Tax=Mycobacterium asiaticum TaxID=1790 RepID=A0A1A3NS43_MYCAS|nr:chorismate mutase [Mycobacterium asiaticum]